ncbi:antibiotic biosynthesis monooxygenase family protein [Paenactinomyces guangxiensis]|uniref:Antibiotic biosynthesis monooxygenase n=1 Tax=Paenactinomyces guangxiensis TaxID=1490290 RepID=A0A7W1WV11_9BACL|nr:antibiotic biosynthesis monooxygenase [Paenactinomyces guangxiensis]MBA4496566.1 antibiotic biosynthesis monooxygenase [Paenactinomyces guangxiensis]MBH8593691.1 antibiotic biosynthesis monooxygenase [Paenactinomyces guangxiensis]
MSLIAKTPNPPYYAVIFTSERTEVTKGYEQMAERMLTLASEQPGFLGEESFRDENGFGVTISYWDSLEAIKQWKENSFHQVAQNLGKKEWYKRYKTRVCKVEKDYFFLSE